MNGRATQRLVIEHPGDCSAIGAITKFEMNTPSYWRLILGKSQLLKVLRELLYGMHESPVTSRIYTAIQSLTSQLLGADALQIVVSDVSVVGDKFRLNNPHGVWESIKGE